MEKEMTTHSSVLVWKIPWTEERGGLQCTGSQRVGNYWATEQNVTAEWLLSVILKENVTQDDIFLYLQQYLLSDYNEHTNYQDPTGFKNYIFQLMANKCLHNDKKLSSNTHRVLLSLPPTLLIFISVSIPGPVLSASGKTVLPWIHCSTIIQNANGTFHIALQCCAYPHLFPFSSPTVTIPIFNHYNKPKFQYHLSFSEDLLPISQRNMSHLSLKSIFISHYPNSHVSDN